MNQLQPSRQDQCSTQRPSLSRSPLQERPGDGRSNCYAEARCPLKSPISSTGPTVDVENKYRYEQSSQELCSGLSRGKPSGGTISNLSTLPLLKPSALPCRRWSRTSGRGTSPGPLGDPPHTYLQALSLHCPVQTGSATSRAMQQDRHACLLQAPRSSSISFKQSHTENHWLTWT